MLKNPVFWVVVIGLVLLLFGASRLPDIAGNVGKSLKVFKKEIKELQDDTDMSDAKTVLHEDQPSTQQPAPQAQQAPVQQPAPQAQQAPAQQPTQAPQQAPEQRSTDTTP